MHLGYQQWSHPIFALGFRAMDITPSTCQREREEGDNTSNINSFVIDRGALWYTDLKI